MRIGKLEIKARRWPWQKGYNWHGALHSAPLNPPSKGRLESPRFGGGWKYELGVYIGGRSISLCLLFGMINFRWLRQTQCLQCKQPVNTPHLTTCPKFSATRPADHWLNKVEG